jgi:hypothetical protein
VNPTPSSRAARDVPRILASAALLTVALTFLLAQVDFVRRNHIGIAAERYWRPQLLRIWLPGLCIALGFCCVAFVLHRRGRRA